MILQPFPTSNSRIVRKHVKIKNKKFRSPQQQLDFDIFMNFHQTKLRLAILNNGYKIWIPGLNAPGIYQNTNSCFNMLIVPRDMMVYDELKKIRDKNLACEKLKVNVDMTADQLLALNNGENLENIKIRNN